jgi:hypothetical protein
MAKRISWTAVIVASVLVVVVLHLLESTLCRFNHNEHMYIAAAWLVRADLALYRDFAYVQAPYLPLLYAAVFGVTGTSHYLLFGKLASYAFAVTTGIFLFLACRRVSRDATLSLSLVAVLLLNSCVIDASSEASNYAMPMALSMGGLYLFLRASGRGWSRIVLMFLAGVLLSAASCTKLYYLVVPLPLAVLCLRSSPGERDGRAALAVSFLPFMAGLLAGALPAIWYMLQDFELFAFNNLGYHRITGAWRDTVGSRAPMSCKEKLDYASSLFVRISYFMPIVLLVTTLVASLRRLPGNPRWSRKTAVAGGLLCLVLFTFAAAFFMRPLWEQYLAMPVPFMLVCTAALAGLLTEDERWTVRTASVVMVTLLVLCAHSGHLRSLKRLGRADSWQVSRIHGVAREIGEALEEAGARGKVATLAPVYVVDADLPIYSELATGPFLYRVGDRLTGAERTRYHATSPESISDLLEEEPPAAILVGYERHLEGPLVEFARKSGYRKARLEIGGGTLYIRR